MFGSIMPAPLAMPPTWNVPDGVVTRTAASLGAVSVVMMARAASRWFVRDERRAAAAPTPAANLVEVELDADDAGRRHQHLLRAAPDVDATKSAVLRATARPSGPVQALAQPLLTTMARDASAGLRARCSRAHEHGRGLGLVRREHARRRRRCVGHDERQVEGVGLLDAARHAGRAEAVRRRDAARDRLDGEVGFLRVMSRAGAPETSGLAGARDRYRPWRTGRSAGTGAAPAVGWPPSRGATCAARSRTRAARRTAGPCVNAHSVR